MGVLYMFGKLMKVCIYKSKELKDKNCESKIINCFLNLTMSPTKSKELNMEVGFFGGIPLSK